MTSDHPLSAELIEAFCLQGLSGRAPSTRGTYRSVLRSLSGGPSASATTPFKGSLAPPPYSLAERAELWATARSQQSPWRRHSALALVCCGMGAGLRARELVSVRGGDVRREEGTTIVSVGDGLGRLVPVFAPYDVVLDELSCLAPRSEHLFRPGPADRSYKNFVNDFCAKLVRDPSSPTVSVLRCRSSFICDHLAQKTPLWLLVATSGLEGVESLRRHGVYVQGVPRTNAGLRRALLKEQAP